MLRILLLALSALSDYQAVADTLQSAFNLALVNTGLLFVLGAFQLIRRFIPTRHPLHSLSSRP